MLGAALDKSDAWICVR